MEGPLAQLVECPFRIREVPGSKPGLSMPSSFGPKHSKVKEIDIQKIYVVFLDASMVFFFLTSFFARPLHCINLPISTVDVGSPSLSSTSITIHSNTISVTITH